MKLRSKLLLSFILTTLVLVAALFFMLRWSFEQGAATYLRQMDQENLVALAVELADYYAGAGSWDAFVGQPQHWRDWLRDKDAGPRRRFSEQRKDTVAGRRSRFIKPYFLLDAERRALVGRSHRDALLAPIEVEGDGDSRAVGYVGLPPPPSRLVAFRKNPLAKQQLELFLSFTIGALLLSVIAAIPLSARWVRRILQLHDYVGTLSRGHYQTRLPVAGNDEIAALAQHLNALAQTLASVETQRRQMTADVSHELRTPVASLQATIEAMQDGVVPMDQAGLVQMHEQVRRLGRLIDDLYQLSLADAGALRYDKTECDLTELLEQLVAGYRSQFQRRQLALEVRFAAHGTALVWVDVDRLKQLFTNILENSLRYTNSPGSVRIAVGRADRWWQVVISDSAPGVDQSLQGRLTDRLFRVEDSRNRASGGAGLGLNLCAAIARAHGGELHFGDSDLGGLAVTVKLPVMEKV